MSHRTHIIARLALLLYLVGMAVAMLLPLGGLPVSLNRIRLLGFRGDHVVHAAMFVGLLLIMGYNRRVSAARWWRSLWPWLLLAMLLAVGSELLQGLLGIRRFSTSDMQANLVGIALGLLPFLMVGRNRQIKHRHENG